MIVHYALLYRPDKRTFMSACGQIRMTFATSNNVETPDCVTCKKCVAYLVKAGMRK